MAQDALGLIEAVGLVTAIAAADAGAKSANVTVRKLMNTKGGGLMTVVFEGDVAAVQAAVDAGAAEARRIGTVASVHVIARPAGNMGGIIGAPAGAPVAPPTLPAAGSGSSPAPGRAGNK